MYRFAQTLTVLSSITLLAAQALALPPCPGDIYSKDLSVTTPEGLDDPFYPNQRHVSGKFIGQCIDTSEKRTVTLLTAKQSEAYGGKQKGTMMVANFSHEGRFWIARIPLHDISEVIYQLDHWGILGTLEDPNKGPDAGHGQIRFRFEKPIILTPQVPSMTYPATRVELYDLVYSIEVAGPRGTSWGNDAVMGNFVTANRFVSLPDRANYFFVRQQHVVSQYRLNLTPHEARTLLTYSAQRSSRLGYTQQYRVLTQNCISELLATIDEVIDKRKMTPFWTQIKIQKEIYWNDMFQPSTPERSLYSRGLVSFPDLGKINDLNTEFPDMHFTAETKTQ